MYNFQSKLIPESPGVYIFKDKENKIIYVGKAKNLRNRVTSYFLKNDDRIYKKHLIVDSIFDIETIATNSEKEALILESNLIKKNSPKYNVLLKDNSEYCFVKIGKNKNEIYSTINIIRKKTEDSFGESQKKENYLYFGPYTSKKDLMKTIDSFSKIFPFKCLKIKELNNKYSKEAQNIAPILSPCFNYHIKKCCGICCGKATVIDYDENINNLVNLLKGKNDSILEYLNSKMSEFANRKMYEIAAQYRDKINIVEKISGKQFARDVDNKNIDIISVYKYCDLACVNLFNIRNGVLLGKRNFILKNVLKGFLFEEDNREQESILIERFITSYYLENLEGVNIITQYDVDKGVASINSNIISIKTATNEKQLSLVALGEKNSIDYINKNQINSKNLEKLKEKLNMDKLPKRIECFDISNIQGKFPVGSMPVFIDGLPAKDQYRKFKIKTLPDEPNDFYMMREVLSRRLSKKNLDEWGVPDLIVIDGGIPQLSVFATFLNELKDIEKDKNLLKKIFSIKFVALAKQEEEVFILDGNSVSKVDGKTLYILRQIRDEAHRFGITFFRKLYREQFKVVKK